MLTGDWASAANQAVDVIKSVLPAVAPLLLNHLSRSGKG